MESNSHDCGSSRRPSLPDPILGPAIFDRRLRLFRQLSTYSDGRIVVKDAPESRQRS